MKLAQQVDIKGLVVPGRWRSTRATLRSTSEVPVVSAILDHSCRSTWVRGNHLTSTLYTSMPLLRAAGGSGPAVRRDEPGTW